VKENEKFVTLPSFYELIPELIRFRSSVAADELVGHDTFSIECRRRGGCVSA